MDDNKFWIWCWFILSALLLGIVTSTQVYFTVRNSIVLEMIKQGVPPMEAQCLVGYHNSNTPTCVILATKKVEE